MNQSNEPSKQVSDLVFGVLSARNRHRARTDLKNLYRAIKRNEPDLDEDQFTQVFKNLAATGAGSLVVGRRGNPNRFIWKYNLKDIAEAALTSGVKPSTFETLGNKPKEQAPVVKKEKRAKKAIRAIKMKAKPEVKVKTQRPEKQPVTAKTGTFLQIDLSTMSPEDVKALVDLVSKK